MAIQHTPSHRYFLPSDLKNPKTNKHTAGFTKEEREDFSQLLKEGFVDTFRHFYPDLTEAYTYWGYRFNCRAKNIGWCVCVCDEWVFVSELRRKWQRAGWERGLLVMPVNGSVPILFT